MHKMNRLWKFLLKRNSEIAMSKLVSMISIIPQKKIPWLPMTTLQDYTLLELYLWIRQDSPKSQQ